MPDDLAALTLLGESADWLKDAEGLSIRDHRIAVIEAYQAAWAAPTDEPKAQALRESMARLFEALRHNHLYPDAFLFNRATEGPARFLPEPGTLRKDFEQIRNLAAALVEERSQRGPGLLAHPHWRR